MTFRLSVRLGVEYQKKLESVYKQFNVENDNATEMFKKLLDTLHNDEFVRVEDLGNEFSSTPFTDDKPVFPFIDCRFASPFIEKGQPMIWCDDPAKKKWRGTTKVPSTVCVSCQIRAKARKDVEEETQRMRTQKLLPVPIRSMKVSQTFTVEMRKRAELKISVGREDLLTPDEEDALRESVSN